MNKELVFRIVFWTFLLLVILFNRIIPAFRAKKSGGNILPDEKAIKKEGKTTFILRVILFVLFLAFLVLYSIYPPFMDLLRLDFPVWLRWAGTLLAFVGVAFWIYSQKVLDKYWSPQLQIQKEHKIITNGPYKVIRHPIYTAMFIWVTGLAFFTANMIFVLLALLTIVGLVIRVPKEEKMMTDQFGEEYKKYMQSTRRFFKLK